MLCRNELHLGNIEYSIQIIHFQWLPKQVEIKVNSKSRKKLKKKAQKQIEEKMQYVIVISSYMYIYALYEAIKS